MTLKGISIKNRTLSIIALAITMMALGPLSLKAEEGGSFWEKTKVMGSIDVNYNYNLQRPTTTAVATAANTYRVFDNAPNTFNIGLVDIALENTPTDWVTFRTDLDFGRDATFFHAVGLGAATDVFNLQQAYVALKAAQVGNGLSFKVGKFVGLHGMEVIEAASNYNISRGLLFNYAIPFTLIGVIGDYPFSDVVSLNLGVVNGWNNLVDNNNGKSIYVMFTVKPNEMWTFLLGGTAGPEAAGRDRTWRLLADTSLIYKPADAWTLALNYNLGRDEAFAAGAGAGIADWQGVAAYVDWKATDLWGLTIRNEFFEDDVGALGVVATPSARVYEGTLTSHTYLTEGLDLRFEFRHDQGSNNSFSGARKFQDTIASQLVYSF